MITIKKTIITILGIILFLELIAVGYFAVANQQGSKKQEIETLITKEDQKRTPVSESSDVSSEPLTTESPDKHENWLKSDSEISFPILMYHSLSEGNSLKIPPAEFKQHMEWLKKEGYYTLTPEEAYDVLTLNKKPAEKIVWITFDDGYLNNYTDGFPILKELDLKATINYITTKIEAENTFNLAQMKEMSDSGLISIQSHTVNHLEVNVMPYDQQFSEMADSKKFLDDQLKQNTTTLCYPAGRYDENNFKTAKDAGYQLALTTEPGYAQASDGLYALKRVRVSPGYDGAGFGNLLLSNQ